MPELPEVETVVRMIRPDLVTRTIVSARFLIPRQLKPQTVAAVRRKIIRQRIIDVSRQGKYILIQLERDLLLIHLRMTGRMFVRDSKSTDLPYERAFFELDNQQTLVFRDPRTLGTISVYNSGEDIPPLKKLGLDPLTEVMTLESLRGKLLRRSIAIKPLLLNQSIWAGIGNIYASEILWEAGIHPEKSANQLSRPQLERLIRAVPLVLGRALKKGGSTLRDFMSPDGKRGAYQKEFRVYDCKDEPCPRCDAPIQQTVQAQRSTYFCKRCQRRR
jgi:formamidopyrimidine-DNA glycosylase